MKVKRGYQIALIIMNVFFVLCLLLPMFKLDLSYITGRLADVFDDPEVWENGAFYNVFSAITKLKDLDKDVKDMVSLYYFAVFLPHIFNLIILVLAFFRKKTTTIVTVILAACSACFMLVMNLKVLPSAIKSYVEDVIDGSFVGTIISWLNPKLSGEVGQQLADVYRGSLSWGFWISLMLMFLIMVVSAISLVDLLYAEHKNPVQKIKKEKSQEKVLPILRDICGVYQYAEFPVEDGTALIIGRNPEECNIIVKGEKVSRKHCAVSYDKTTGQYRVEDFSTNGTFISGRGKMTKGSVLTVPSGTKIALGERDHYNFQVG